MALNTPQITPTKKITVRAIGEELPRGDYQRCPQCDMLFSLPEINSHQSAYCPRCQAKIRDGRDWSLTRLAAMAFTMLLLMPFAWGEPLLHIWLLGIRIDANVMQGIWQMTKQGDAITGSMVFFCVIGAPLILVTSIAYLWFGNRLRMNLRPVLLMLERLKEWVMLDIYLVGIGVASIKVQDYAHIQAGVGLFSFVALVILTTGGLSTADSDYRVNETRQFARMLGLKSKNTAVRSPVSNGIAESFMKTIKRDYISIMPKLVVCFLWSSLCSVLRKNILEPVEQMNAWIRGAINKKKKWK